MFGLFTVLTGFASSYGGLVATRFCAGIGLGGAAPCFIVLASEYAPRRRRAMIASLMWAAFPLGGAIGGFVNAYLVQAFGWQSIFLAGGFVPLAIAAVLAGALPESFSFLCGAGRRAGRIRAVVTLIDPGAAAGAAVRYAFGPGDPGAAPGTARLALAELFRAGRRGVTACTWAAFFMAFGALTILAMWIPVVLRAKGIGLSQASLALGIFGFGAFAGSAVAGRPVERFGGLAVLIPAFLAGALMAAGCGAFASSFGSVSLWMAGAGVFVTMGASGLVAVAATAYPVSIRSTAIGCAMGMGRAGQVVWPMVIGAVLGMGVGKGAVLGAASLSAVLAAAAVLAMSLAARAGEWRGQAGDASFAAVAPPSLASRP